MLLWIENDHLGRRIPPGVHRPLRAAGFQDVRVTEDLGGRVAQLPRQQAAASHCAARENGAQVGLISARPQGHEPRQRWAT